MYFGGALVDAQANFLRAGEANETRLRVVDQQVADHGVFAGNEVDDTGRHANLGQNFHELVGDYRRARRGFEHHRIARHQRGHHQAGGNRQREVPGWDGQARAERDVLHFGVLARQLINLLRPGQALHLARVVLAKVDRLGNVGICFSPVLIDLVDHPGAQLVDAVAHDRGGFHQVAHTLLGAGFAPGIEAGMCHFKRARGLLGRGA